MGKKSVLLILLLCLLSSIFPSKTAQAQGSGFALQVTPSPIVETLQPGTTKQIELKIRNQSSQTERLKMGLRSFNVNNEDGSISLLDTEPEEVSSWVRFKEPIFDVAAGEWYTQRIEFSVPENAGFSYYFAITISREKPSSQQPGAAAIEGSVAVFTLLTIDRPDAVKKIDSITFTSKKKVYDYLPARLELSIKNSGNTIVRPAGNVYIQRSIDDAEPITVLPVNATGAYILPETTRKLETVWESGFPVKKNDTETGKESVVWNWNDLQNFRIGKYTAKAVLIYNDGQRDIPVEAVVEFWVLPWKLLTVLFILAAILLIGIASIIKKFLGLSKQRAKRTKQSEKQSNDVLSEDKK